MMYPSTHTCPHPSKTRAVNVSLAIGRDGSLAGEERQKFYKIKPTLYAAVEFCSNPGCEHVFKAEKV